MTQEVHWENVWNFSQCLKREFLDIPKIAFRKGIRITKRKVRINEEGR